MDIYIFFVIILFALAISDLIVGVSNDAVNFLISAIGSKSASRWAILLVASLGVVVGATFSSGMMEVARKGIFHPGMFHYSEIMIIFLGVMLTDILLLDLFNTFGMPTSTTVSIVFELLGGAVAVAFLKVKGNDVGAIGDYINTAKALAIISGILISVVVAFTAGVVVQYITRLVFSFKTNKTLKYYGALWGGFGITAITYFMIVKGLKGSTYASHVLQSGITIQDWVDAHVGFTMLISFIFWTIVLQLINLFLKVNILKIVVLTGTFALAMAFAGNDLVNFIGVPLAGLRSHQLWMSSGESASQFFMTGLAGKVSTPSLYLVIAGLVMVGTLVFSKKSRSVTKTSVDLSRQDEGDERFGSSILSRSIVRGALTAGNAVKFIISSRASRIIEKRFNPVQKDFSLIEGAEFDLVRASVNLIVASILISFATSLKLPLSTTYVTFMVAMGSSLADGAWGRESAVFRITGVMSVIGGWFLTAFVAFTVSFIMAMIISWGGVYAVCLVLVFIIFVVYRSNQSHKKRTEQAVDHIEASEGDKVHTIESIVNKSKDEVSFIFSSAPRIIEKALQAFIDESRKELKKQVNEADELNLKIKKQKDKLYKVIGKIKQEYEETGHYYVQVIDFQRELARCLTFITNPLFNHVDNNHRGVIEPQEAELKSLASEYGKFFDHLRKMVELSQYENFNESTLFHDNLFKLIEKYRKNQVKRIKQKAVGTRNSMLYLNLLAELRNITLFSVNILKSQRDFEKYSKLPESFSQVVN